MKVMVATLSVLVAGTLGAQTPDIETCSAPSLPFGGEFGTPPTIEDTLTVIDDQFVADVQVFVNITHSFVGDLIVELSHNETTVGLHNALGEGIQDLRVTYNDSGAPHGSEPFDCDCAIAPSGPGILADLWAGGIVGDWTLRIDDIFPELDDGALDRWCLRFFKKLPPPPPPPVGNLVCTSPPGSGIIQAAWTNSIPYDFFLVFIDGVEIATLPGSSFIYASPPQSVPSVVDFSVKGFLNGIASPIRTCPVGIMQFIDVDECTFPAAPISNANLPVVSPMTIDEVIQIGDVQAIVDITHTFVGDLSVNLTSPANTTVFLHNNNGEGQQDIRVTYWEFGADNGEVPYDCQCFVQPSGPGTLLDFLGESTFGTWTLRIIDFFAGDSGVLNQWCLRGFINMPVFPVQQLTCTSGVVPGTVELSWLNALPYAEIDIRVNGALETTLPGPFGAGQLSSYATLPQFSPGVVNVCVIPRHNGVSGPQRCCTVDVVLAPIADLSVSSVGGSGEAIAEWTNPLVYDSVEVLVNGAVEATLSGTTTSYTTAPQPIPSPATVCVRGVINSFGTSPERCASLFILDEAVIEGCSSPNAPISSELPPVVDTVTINDSLVVLDLEVAVSLTHTFIGDLTIDLASPTGTSIRLHDQGGGPSNDVLAIYSDAGAENGSTPYHCGCPLQPSGNVGFGSLSNVIGDLALGTWTLTISDLFAEDSGTLVNWCLRVLDACDLQPPTDVVCTPIDGEVLLSWNLDDVYDSIDIERNGIAVDTIPGNATSYLDSTVDPGGYTYRIIGQRTVNPCASPSESCMTAFGITDIVFAGEFPSFIDSVAALRSALTTQGRVVMVIDILDPAMLAPRDSSVEAIWVQLGTFPDNRSLSDEEGLLLAEFHTGDVGLDGVVEFDPVSVYLEGADVWGFDPPTPLTDYDGVEHESALDGDDSLASLTGVDSGVGLDLGGGDFDAVYVQDQLGNDYTDRLTPALFVPDLGGTEVGTIWRGSDKNGPFNVGLFYNSTVAPFISQSFEFGGYGGDQELLALRYLNALLGLPPASVFRRGDANADGSIDVGDPIFILGFLFIPGSLEPLCPDAADSDDNGSVTLLDALTLLDYIFLGVIPTLPAPGPIACGEDTTLDLQSECVYSRSLCQ